MHPTNRTIMQVQSSSIILCVDNNRSIQIFNFRGSASDKQRLQGGQAQGPHPCLSFNCPKIDLCVVSKTFYISGATCPIGTHETAAWKERRSGENPCVCGLNGFLRRDVKTKVSALLSSIDPLPQPPRTLNSSQLTQRHQNNISEQHGDGLLEPQPG